MKKLMALCLSVLVALSMCSFTVMAEGTISFEDISNGQSQSSIVSDLAFPADATVESSNETVISTEGKVTRPLIEDANVTLTVNGTTFEVTVKAKSVGELTDDEKKEYFSKYLTPEVFANGQSLASVSSNLTLSTGFDMEAIGASLVWTTSDPTVIETNGTIHPKDNTSVNAVIQGTLTIGEEEITTKKYSIKLAPKGTVESTDTNLNWDFEDATEGYATSTAEKGVVNSEGIYFYTENYSYVNDSERGMILSSTPSKTPVQIEFHAGQKGPGYTKRFVYGFDYKFIPRANSSPYIETYMRGASALHKIGTKISSDNIQVEYPAASGGVTDTLFTSKVPHYEDITEPNVWHHIDIDYNATKDVYSIYVDDILINSIPGSWGGSNKGSYPIYWFHITPHSTTSFQLDNIYVNEYTDSDIVKADGALRSAVYNAAARETGVNGQPGPYKTIIKTNLDSVITSGSVPTPQSDSNGATLTWKVNGEPHTAATYTAPAGAKTATFEVTASYNGKSVTQTFTNRFAPVEIISSTVEDNILKSVTVEGNYTGKQLTVVSVSATDGKVNNVKLIDIAGTTVTLPDDSITDNGNDIYFYIFDKETLLPYAFKR